MERDWKFITPQIEQIAAEFGGHHVKRRVGLPKGPLYHYTTGENLIRIIESGELWSTQAACALLHALQCTSSCNSVRASALLVGCSNYLCRNVTYRCCQPIENFRSFEVSRIVRRSAALSRRHAA